MIRKPSRHPFPDTNPLFLYVNSFFFLLLLSKAFWFFFSTKNQDYVCQCITVCGLTYESSCSSSFNLTCCFFVVTLFTVTVVDSAEPELTEGPQVLAVEETLATAPSEEAAAEISKGRFKYYCAYFTPYYNLKVSVYPVF